MDDYIEIKAIVTQESYSEFFKKKNKEKNIDDIFVLLSQFFDVKQIELHKAYFQEYPAQKRLTVSGNGSIMHKKGFESTKIIE